MPAAAAPAPEPTPDSALTWLLGVAAPEQRQLTAADRAWIAPLDNQLRATELPADVLPRMPSVIPQLMGMLRQEQPSRSAMVLQMQKDVLLTAEVLRVARSPFYGSQPVETLESALDRIGTSGLQSAMSRLLLKPVFDAQGDGLLAQAAPRLWQHSDYKALMCSDLVGRSGGDRFEGYLAGLLHDSGWLALLRLMERLQMRPQWPLSQAMDRALDQRKDRLFGRLTAGWALTPGLSALSRHLADPRQPCPALWPLLQAADRSATADLARG
jgi:HDOD domain